MDYSKKNNLRDNLKNEDIVSIVNDQLEASIKLKTNLR